MLPSFVGHSIADATGTIIGIDSSIGDLLYRAPAEIIGKSYTAITCAYDVDWNVRKVRALPKSGAPITLRKRYTRPDGSLVLADVEIFNVTSARLGLLTVGTIFRVDGEEDKLSPEALWCQALRARALCLMKSDELGPELFADLGWLTMLELYLAECEGRTAFDTTAISSIGQQPDSRWLSTLMQNGLIEPSTGSAYRMQLSANGISKVEKVLAAEIRSSERGSSK